MENKNLTCAECGIELERDDHFGFEGHTYCRECFDRITVECDNCMRRIWRDNAVGNDNYTLCEDCQERYYTYCEECGRLIHNEDSCYFDEDDMPYCRDCFESLNCNSIKNYGYKPEPIFYGSGDLFLGVELEVDKGGHIRENAQELIEIANTSTERVYCKHDGSLNDGFEIVSHPMDLTYHTKEMPWKDILTKAASMGYLSHNTNTCGLHIHCSRDAFGKTYEEQEDAIGRVVFFVEKHWNELVRFSRRKWEHLNRWAAKYSTISDSPQETYKKAKDRNMGRYVAVNLTNYNTIEFRMFRGTLRYKTFIATLQLVEEICKTAIRCTDREIEETSWSDWVSEINVYSKPELIEYLKLKRLYVNEITEETEEL